MLVPGESYLVLTGTGIGVGYWLLFAEGLEEGNVGGTWRECLAGARELRAETERRELREEGWDGAAYLAKSYYYLQGLIGPG